MSFLKFSNDFNSTTHTLVDNIFIAEYLPYAPDMCAKVYLYGLYLCSRESSPENDMELMARALSIETADIINAYTYWQEFGLVHLLKKNPPEVRYLPIKSGMSVLKRIKPSKYADFNLQLQEMFPDRMLSANEFNEYYNVMETLGIAPDAMLLTARYCIELKKGPVGYPYILTVARNWAAEGVKTVAQIEDKLAEYGAMDRDLREVLSALKSKKESDFEDRQMFLKWKNELGFDLSAIIYAAKSLKGKGGLPRLDGLLRKFFESRIMTAEGMDNFIRHKDRLYALAKEVTKRLGVYYERLDYIVETYILEWFNKGFEEEQLYFIADYCFKNGIKQLGGLDKLIEKLDGKGLTDVKAIEKYLKKLPAPPTAEGARAKAVPYIDKNYSEEELSGLFNKLDEEM